ncbi:MAG: hypothetical protein ACREIT_10315 [Tepidisphaeraceae bacterium]
MRWLLHGTMTPAVGEALRRHGHQAQAVSELELGADAMAGDVLTAAHTRQLDILTTDQTMANAPFELQQKFGRTIVFLQLEGGDVEQDDAVDRLFARYKRLAPGKLYTVTGTRVKIRQLPGAH